MKTAEQIIKHLEDEIKYRETEIEVTERLMIVENDKKKLEDYNHYVTICCCKINTMEDTLRFIRAEGEYFESRIG